LLFTPRHDFFSLDAGALLADQLRQEGKLEGKTEGLFEGRLSALRASVLCALEIRHGACPDGVREVIEASEDPNQLQHLLESAIRSDSIEAFAQNL